MPATLERSARIDEILAKRQPAVERVDRAAAALVDLGRAMDALEETRNEMIGHLADEPTTARLRALNVEDVRRTIAEQQVLLGRLRERFARRTLNVGVIGRARQGKSQLLQRLSGLTTSEVPTGSGSHCTGVRSTIIHDATQPPHGEVTFHDKATFLREVIAPYYRTLRLGPEPRSLQIFRERPLPLMDASTPPSAALTAKYEHLRQYHEWFDKYAPLLGRAPLPISIDQVREYVAQDTVDGQRIYANYLAVERVSIFCPFPFSDIGRIALIDMPGLGDTGIGHEERLVTVLGQDVDFVLFVKLPKPTGDFWAVEDLALYDLARSSLTELPIEQWSFMVLNRTAAQSGVGSNEHNCTSLAADAVNKGVLVSKCVIADCTDAGQVQSRILDELLEQLGRTITVLDDHYAAVCQARLAACHSQVEAMLDAAAVALGRGTATEGEWQRFDELFGGSWDALTGGLEDLLTGMRRLKTQPNRLLLERLEACIQQAKSDTGIPSPDEIERLAKRHGSYSTAFNNYLHKVRTHLVGHFGPLEDTLRLSLEDVREQVAVVLKRDGRLDRLSSASGTAFVRELSAIVPKECAAMKTAFCDLSSVELTYRGFLQYRMRDYLDWLHPDGPEKGEQIRVTSSAAGVRQALSILYDRVIYQLENVFEKWAQEPNRVAVAIVEEFVDRVLRSGAAYDDWRAFYRENRSAIWQAEFNALGEQSRWRSEWDRLVSGARKTNAVDHLRILS